MAKNGNAGLEERTGFCKYCGQAQMVEAAVDVSQEELDELATRQCNCGEAKEQRKKQKRMENAELWARSNFSENNGEVQTVMNAVKAVGEYVFDNMTIKKGKFAYRIYVDKDGMICVKTTYKDNEIETF